MLQVLSMNKSFCLGAFDHKVDEFVGSPMMIGCLFVNNDDDFPVSVTKTFDMDEQTYDSSKMQTSLSKLDPKKCFLRLIRGSLPDQMDGSNPELVLSEVVCTFAVEFEAATFDEFLKNGCLSDDPPVLSARIVGDVAWASEGSSWMWANGKWKPEGLEIFIDGSNVTLSFFGPDIPNNAFDSLSFSHFK